MNTYAISDGDPYTNENCIFNGTLDQIEDCFFTFVSLQVEDQEEELKEWCAARGYTLTISEY